MRESIIASPRRLALIVAAVLTGLGPGTAVAAPSYYVYLTGAVQQGGSTPIHLSLDYTYPSSSNVHVIGYATPGRIGGMVDVVSHFGSVFSDGGSHSAQVQATTDDVIITGPGSSIHGMVYFTANVAFDIEGGYGGNGGHGANAGVNAWAASYYNYGATGEAHSNNHDSGGSGVFAGAGPGGASATIAVEGDFPVGSPFGLGMSMNYFAATYGNDSVSPAIARVSLGTLGPGSGVGVGAPDGHVMDLPAGYTVNSASWGIVNNTYAPTVAVAPQVSGTFQFDRVSPNPSASDSRLAFTLPHEGDVRVVIMDVQGREVRKLAAGRYPAGRTELIWDGRDASGRPVGPGVFLAVASLGETRATRRIARLR